MRKSSSNPPSKSFINNHRTSAKEWKFAAKVERGRHANTARLMDFERTKMSRSGQELVFLIFFLFSFSAFLSKAPLPYRTTYCWNTCHPNGHFGESRSVTEKYIFSFTPFSVSLPYSDTAPICKPWHTVPHDGPVGTGPGWQSSPPILLIPENQSLTYGKHLSGL